ncbi:CBS domain-containing protein [Sphingomicrobium lutaoense]|uniref:CBS domain-containing protein n=1 Tax=Sphingomicrobium lutaoense TaxID=515949 RepID=A0A839Z2Y4_9SPHN|nr:CBS domain-containing protein [Sphingomicrobium lutaoense]MBB3764908.1 CBS domain-containing protein [Sphingomicrobium lutaoense]
MTIATILEGKGHEVVTISDDASIGEAVSLLAGRRIGAVPVLKGDTVAGILSERDIINCLARDGGCILDWPVSRLMSSPALTVTRDCTCEEAMTLMTEKRIRHLPVEESGRLEGIVSIGDLVKHRIELAEQDAEAMRSYIQAT